MKTATTYTVNEMWDFLISHEIATRNEMSLVTHINGCNEKALNDILYVRTGYHSIAQFLEEYE